MLSRLALYPTVQVFLSLALGLILVAFSMPPFMNFLSQRRIGQQIRADGPQRHLIKEGTPTMGGLVILLAMALVFFLMVYVVSPSAQNESLAFLREHDQMVRGALLVIGTTLACGLLGLIDDSAKVVRERSLGLRARAKIIGQVLIAIIFSMLAINWVGITPDLQIPATTIHIPLNMFTTAIPWFGDTLLGIPWLYIVFASLMLISMTNAVNLTDGLDGLAAGTVVIVTLIFGAIAFAQDNLPVAIVAAAISGACIGFLWYNAYPAEIFMGDTGSLGLGGALAALAAVTKTELLLIIVGGIFVIEALSVVIQVLWYKRLGTRVFKMAPIHHHFEMLGWSETKVMVRFWIVTAVLAGFGFAIYFFQQGGL
ncbi:MAG: phospho-N-acetylmuramoyl-pentapeptide-transferase, partial [Actinomycetia bacterium]|nr:phospho-N-acetylmuramoyl-pentapeptide-transferase [Actinomycetes bacterium]